MFYITKIPSTNCTKFHDRPFVLICLAIFCTWAPSLLNRLQESTELNSIPMCRNLPQPRQAGVLHGGIRVQALGDGVGDQRAALFLKQLDQPLLLLDQRIELGRFPVEEGGDLVLFDNRRNCG